MRWFKREQETEKTLEERATELGIPLTNENPTNGYSEAVIRAVGKDRDEALRRLNAYRVKEKVASFYKLSIEDHVSLGSNQHGIRITGKGYVTPVTPAA